jgi:hypothetical protein
MKTRKPDWLIVREAEEKGLMASMTSIVESKRTELNERLSNYFRSKLPNYEGTFDEYVSEDILCNINEYLEKNKIDKKPLDFPLVEGADIHLIPIGENIKLKVMVVDEYYGGGEYEKYVDISRFMINENTTEQDVDLLIDFVNKYLQ